MEDFRDWTNWLLYRGGIGVKGEESWEAWWDEELVWIFFPITGITRFILVPHELLVDSTHTPQLHTLSCSWIKNIAVLVMLMFYQVRVFLSWLNAWLLLYRLKFCSLGTNKMIEGWNENCTSKIGGYRRMWDESENSAENSGIRNVSIHTGRKKQCHTL